MSSTQPKPTPLMRKTLRYRVLLRRRCETRESNKKLLKGVICTIKICCLSHSCRILGKKVSRSTRLDDVSQLEIVLSCSGAGPSYMPHKVSQCGALSGSCGESPASLRYNLN